MNNDIPVDRRYFTLGFLSQLFQRTPADLRVILAAAGVQPTHSINDVPYFDAYGFLAIGRALREARGDE